MILLFLSSLFITLLVLVSSYSLKYINPYRYVHLQRTSPPYASSHQSNKRSYQSFTLFSSTPLTSSSASKSFFPALAFLKNIFRRDNSTKNELVDLPEIVLVKKSVVVENVDAVIVGAGMAGLSCAKSLLDNNFTNFKILESSDRPG